MFDFGNHLRMLREKAWYFSGGTWASGGGPGLGKSSNVMKTIIKIPTAGCPHHYGKDLRCFVRLLGWV